MTARLLDERVVAVNPSLIRAFGASAIVLQQVHWHASNTPFDLEYDGERWWRIEPDDFTEETGLSVHQIRRALAKLEHDHGVLIAVAPLGYNRTKYHRVNHAHEAFCPIRDSASSTAQIRDLHVAKSQTPLSQTPNTQGAQEFRDPECPLCDGSGERPDHTVCECYLKASDRKAG